MTSKPSDTVVPGNGWNRSDSATQGAAASTARAARPRAADAVVSPAPELAKRKKIESAAKHPEHAGKSGASKHTKADLILRKLRTAKGASIDMLIAETGWQAHSVRGFLSAVVKKKLALHLVSESGKDGVRRYRIDSDVKSA
ncbi:MAG: DUF3489 domain-containing protein [Mesorhizobium sp.]|nr:DUF3489 domain-containing protein [Mesorhizobium sp.]MBL8578140.1 DUF3489 domain-containing protein [Mesorhizobium sp.]